MREPHIGALSSTSLAPLYNPEQNMRSKWNSLVVGSCNLFGLALLALSATAGGSAVRAGDPSTLQGNMFEKIALAIEQRVTDLEASVAAFADSFTTKRIVTQELCVADGGGAQTCITKAQLDALLKGALQLGQAPAATEPSVNEETASADKSAAAVAAVAAAAAPSETLNAIEPPGALPVPPAQAEERVGEAAEALPEAPTAVPTAAEPTAAPPTAAGSEAPLPAEATAPLAATAPPATSEPAETIVAASTKPETLIEAERPAKDEEPAQTGPTETDLATPQLKAAPADAPPVSERVEE
jgi:hypothetical protein